MWSKACFRTCNTWSLKFRIALVVCLLASILLLYNLADVSIQTEKESETNFKNDLNMDIDGDEFWTARAKDQGLQTSTELGDTGLKYPTNLTKTCKNFFVVWPGDCLEKSSDLDDRMRTLSAQMMAMNTTLTFFTTDLKGCVWEQYDHIKVALFNATEELIDYGFSEVLPVMNKWDKKKYTRLSDILRICLAHRHQMSYLDTDVHFLQLQSEWYESSYVGAQLWSDSKNAIEITNAAFCLPRSILSDMLGFQISIIRRKKEGKKQKYFYTELGPSMFHHVRQLINASCDFAIASFTNYHSIQIVFIISTEVSCLNIEFESALHNYPHFFFSPQVLLNRRAVTMYSQNNPIISSLDRIASDIHLFGHKQLHLTGAIRKFSEKLKFDQLTNAIRSKSGLPVLEIPPSIAPTAP
jgi:hypothetical protein